MTDQKITRNDIKAKLAEIQGDAAVQVDSAKSQLLAVAGVLGIVLFLLAFFVGRRAGVKKNTIIEITRT